MNSKPTHFYGQRANGREHGFVLTRKKVVAFIFDISGYVAENNLSCIRVLDPAAGEGAFALECLRRLHRSSTKHGFDFAESLTGVTFIEQDPQVRERLSRRLTEYLQRFGISSDNIPQSLLLQSDYLLTDLGAFDLIVGNPPYVRHELIPEEKKGLYRAKFVTFRFRSDLYVAFLESGLRSLADEGTLCFICSDRWMRNKYGQGLRHLVSAGYHLRLVVNLNDADAFDEQVYGYPSIVLITRKPASKTKYTQITDISRLKQVALAFQTGRTKLITFVESTINTDEPWVFDDSPYALLDKAFSTIEQQGFYIGIGVATGCDRIYVGSKLKDLVEPELLLPIVTAKDIINGNIRWRGDYLINPFENGTAQLVDLDKYPKLRAYLKRNEKFIKGRYVAKKNPSHWFRTIDRVYSDLVKKPKLLLPDIRKRQLIAFDEGRYYPHHNIYFITHEDVDRLKILGSLLMSRFVYAQLQGLSVTMRGGYSRWQSQNLRKLKIPRIDQMEVSLKEKLLECFEKKDQTEIDRLTSNIVT